MNEPRLTPAVQIPRSAVTMLSHRCAELGPSGVRALREAGYRAGIEVLPTVADVPEALPAGEFWAALDRRLRGAGLGSIRFEAVSESLGAIAWRESPEAGGTRSERPGARCHFAAGLLAGILSRAAARTVEVLEVECGAGGTEPCWFLFGTVPGIRAVEAVRRGDGVPAADGEADAPADHAANAGAAAAGTDGELPGHEPPARPQGDGPEPGVKEARDHAEPPPDPEIGASRADAGGPDDGSGAS